MIQVGRSESRPDQRERNGNGNETVQIYLTVWNIKGNMGGLENPPFFLPAGIRPLFRTAFRIRPVRFNWRADGIRPLFFTVCSYNV